MVSLSLNLPEELSNALGDPPHGEGDLQRAALEAIAVEAYREHKLSTFQLRRVLGLETRLEVDDFLKRHGVELEYTEADLQRDRAAHSKLGL